MAAAIENNAYTFRLRSIGRRDTICQRVTSGGSFGRLFRRHREGVLRNRENQKIGQRVSGRGRGDQDGEETARGVKQAS